MSHTNHRNGSEESLSNDFVVISLGAKDYTRDGAGPKIGEITKLYKKHNAKNGAWTGWAGPEITADTPSEVFANAHDNGGTHAVFTTEEDLIGFLKDMQEADLGISVNVSGLFTHVGECCHKAGLEPHTVNTSLGIWGNTDRLPEQGVLDVSTMCGHGMVTFALIEKQVELIKANKITARAAAEKLSPLCYCGIFNIDRAERILQELAK